MNGSRPSPLVLGHRGYRARFPENTLLAFREALRAGADGVECDLQKTADGRYVIIHDPGTERVSGAPLEVARSTLDDLRKLDFGRGEPIPPLEELLRSLPADAYLDLELKEETLVPADSAAIVRILDAHRSRERLMISSFDPDLLVPFRRQGFTVGFLVGEEAARRGMRGFAEVLLRLRPHYLNLPVEIVPALGARRAAFLFRTLRLLGFSLLFWTVNDGPQAVSLAASARIVVTDEVEQIIEALRPGGKTTDS
ncbi:MAG: glycerophosphodiester phosphodiesterase family protein [Spirochaetia bacterium]